MPVTSLLPAEFVVPVDAHDASERISPRTPQVPRTAWVTAEAFALVGRRRPYGFTLSLRITTHGSKVVEDFILEHEAVGPMGVEGFTSHCDAETGHAVERDPSFRWLTHVDRPNETESAESELVPPTHRAVPTLSERWLPTAASARRIPLQRQMRAFERFRLDALDAADARVTLLHGDEGFLRTIPSDLREAVMEALDADSTGRLAQVVASRPALLAALGIALGDCPSRWVHEGRLAAPLELVVAGFRDRDVLAAAIESGRGSVATDERIERLRMLGNHVHKLPRANDPVRYWALLAGALDAEAHASWVATPEGGLVAWARAQCWAAAKQLPLEARRYVARFGGSVALVVFGSFGHMFGERVVLAALRNDAAGLLLGKVTPARLVHRAIAARFPPNHACRDEATVDDVRVVRVPDGASARAIGRALRVCLANAGTFRSYAVGCHVGMAAFYEVTWPEGRALAYVGRPDGPWRVLELRTDEDRELDVRRRNAVVRALTHAVPELVCAPGFDDQEPTLFSDDVLDDV